MITRITVALPCRNSSLKPPVAASCAERNTSAAMRRRNPVAYGEPVTPTMYLLTA